MYRCRLCDKHFDSIPTGSLVVVRGRRGGFRLYRFPDGSIHDLKLLKPINTSFVAAKPLAPPAPVISEQPEHIETTLDAVISQHPERESDPDTFHAFFAAFRNYKN